MKIEKPSFPKESDVAIVCHDAGGAEIVSSLIKSYDLKFKFALSGPAKKIFCNKIVIKKIFSINDVLKKSNILLCGTSLPVNIEMQAVQIAKEKGILTVAVLDHWINYRERFLYMNRLIKPDEVWVVDEKASQIAKKTLKDFNIKLMKNPFKQEVIQRLEKYRREKRHNIKIAQAQNILYVTEPTSWAANIKYGNERHWGYTEIEALEYFLEKVQKIAPRIKNLLIRPHPIEREEKYRKYKNFSNEFNIFISAKNNLYKDIMNSDLIFGCNSMAMVVATWAGKKVFCAIPPNGFGFMLPKEGIMSIEDYLHEKQ